MNKAQIRPMATPAPPIVKYIALHPHYLMIRTINEAIPAPKKYPEFSMELAVALNSGGKLVAMSW